MSAAAEKIEEGKEAEEATETVEEPQKATPPGVNRFGLQEEHNKRWRLNVDPSVTPEQCLEEGFWAHLANYLSPGDEITVMPDDMTWKLTLHVIGSGTAYAHVAKEALYDYGSAMEQAVTLPSIYKVEFAGTTHKWRVLREGRMLKDGFQTQQLANRWAFNHEAAVKR